MTLSMRFIACFFLWGTAAYADTASAACDELWFSRNAMMDHAGYCFKSPLGQAVFDNSDCTTSEPKLSKSAQAMTAQIISNEAAFSCDVDTSRTSLPPDVLFRSDQRRELATQPPVPAHWGAEESCGGYLGDPLPVYAAPSRDAAILDVMQSGGDIQFQRHVMLRDKSLEVISQLLLDDDGNILPGYNYSAEPGGYWTFANIYQAETKAYLREGWIYLPSGLANMCTYVAG